jgi:hypothetical protein
MASMEDSSSSMAMRSSILLRTGLPGVPAGDEAIPGDVDDADAAHLATGCDALAGGGATGGGGGGAGGGAE